MCFAFKYVFVFTNVLFVIVLVFNVCSFRYYSFNYYLVVSYFTFIFIFIYLFYFYLLSFWLGFRPIFVFGLILSPIYKPTFRPNLRLIQARGQLKSRGHEQPNTGPNRHQHTGLGTPPCSCMLHATALRDHANNTNP